MPKLTCPKGYGKIEWKKEKGEVCPIGGVDICKECEKPKNERPLPLGIHS